MFPVMRATQAAANKKHCKKQFVSESGILMHKNIRRKYCLRPACCVLVGRIRYHPSHDVIFTSLAVPLLSVSTNISKLSSPYA